MSSLWPFPLLARWRSIAALGLVLAFLWTPIWGQWHGIAHQVRQALAAPAVAASVDAAALGSAKVMGHEDEGHAPGSALCLVLDHGAHASALMAWPLLAIVLSLPVTAPAGVAHPDPAGRASWTSQARAPPRWI